MSDAAMAAATTLRTKQKPLKDKYRSDPSSALVTLSASGRLDASASLTCSLATAGAARKVAGLHQAAGGGEGGFDATGELCSGDMLLEALVACFGVTVRAVATSLGMVIRDGTIVAEGQLDFRGTMGVKDPGGEAVPVGFKRIRLVVGLDVVDVEDRAKVDKLVELSERYCVVLQTIKGGTSVETETRLGDVGIANGAGDGREQKEEQEEEDITGDGAVLRVN